MIICFDIDFGIFLLFYGGLHFDIINNFIVRVFFVINSYED